MRGRDERASIVASVSSVLWLAVACNPSPDVARGAVQPPQEQDAPPRPPALVIDVDPSAEISGVVRAVFEDSRGTLWIGGECDPFRNDGTTLTHYAIKDDLGRGVTIKKIVEGKDGAIWCGTTGGISRFDGNAFTNFTQDGVVEGKEIWCIHEGHSGNIWISAKRSPLYRYDGSAFTKLQEQDEITSLALTLLEDSSGRLWLGGTHGLFRHDGASFVRVTKNGPWR
ncbi:MAG: hypothetical protein FJ293_10815 [Planctomycetes bacterium]|nr:hypothetical protein [Planctomycetota bacterium]